MTWNVFRSLRQIAPERWRPALWSKAFSSHEAPTDLAASVKLWPSVEPPLGLLVHGDEGASEVDILIEAAIWVWFIEAKYGSDISLGTTTRPDRDQVLRNIDVGSYYAGVRPFYFSLLGISERKSPQGLAKAKAYSNFATVRSALQGHRPDGLANLTAVGTLTWKDLAAVLQVAAESDARADEKEYATRAFEWLDGKGLARDGV